MSNDLHPWCGELEAKSRLTFVGKPGAIVWVFLNRAKANINPVALARILTCLNEEKQKDMAAASTEVTQSQ